MSQKLFSSLRARLLILVLLAVGPAFGLILVAAWEGQRRDTNAAQQDALRLAKVASGHQERLVGQARHLLVSLAQLPTVRAGDPAACQALFSNLLKEFPFYTGFAAARPDGEVFCAAPPLAKPVNVSDREWYQRLIQTRGFVIGDYQIGRISGKATIVLAYPVLDSSGQIHGVVTSGLDLTWLSQIAAEATLPPHSTAIVIDSRGTVLSRHPDPERWVGKTMTEIPIVKTILSEREGVADAIGLDGISRLYGFTRLGGDSGATYVGIGIPREAALANANRTLARNLAGLGVVGILALVAAWVGSDLFLLRQVKALLGATRRLGAGDLRARTGFGNRDGELGKLARAFDEMAGSLEERQAEANRARESLDAKIFNLLALNKASHLLATMLDPRSLAEMAVDIVSGIARSGRGALYLKRADGHGFKLAASKSIGPEPFQMEWGEEATLLSTLDAKRGKPFTVTLPPAATPALVVPLTLKDRLEGFILIEERLVPEPWSADDLELLETLAAQVALALENARLVSELLEQFDTLKSTESQLREAERRYRTLVEQIPAVTYTAALDASGSTLYVSPQIETMTGFTRDEWLADPGLWEKRIHPDDRERVLAAYAAAARTGESFSVEYRLLARDGRVAWSRDEAALVRDERGHPQYMHGVMLDVTAEKRVAEELLRQREIAAQREKLAAMGELLAGVAHELNNPLSVVMGQAALLRQVAGEGPLAARADKMCLAAERCARIVSNFLALARHQPPERVATDLNQVVREAIELLAYPLRVDDVRVTPALAGDLPRIWADSHQLHQVVVNLVTNAHHALRAMPGARQLTLATRRHANGVILEVSDTGPGIPPAIIGKIFEPFFTTKPAGQGTGLGLAMVKRIIEEHGGAISVTSDPGMGATFRVELPVGTPPVLARAGEPCEEEARAPVRGKHVLVVDDEREIAAILADLLALHGHTVEIAENGRAAVTTLAEKESYDLILSDIRMPELDGPGLYREVERRDPALGRRFIFVTGDALTPETKEFLKRVGLPCLTKPFTATEVLRVTQQVLQHELSAVSDQQPADRPDADERTLNRRE